MLNPTEQEVIDSLTNAYNKFVLLPPLHPWHNQEFMQGIHILQHLVMARPYLRQLRQVEINQVNKPIPLQNELIQILRGEIKQECITNDAGYPIPGSNPVFIPTQKTAYPDCND